MNRVLLTFLRPWAWHPILAEAMSLKGMRVIVTRPPAQAEPLCTALETAGAQVVRLPMIDIRPLAAPRPALSTYDWLLFTSPNAVLHGLPQLGPLLPALHLAAVGAATAAALRSETSLPVCLPPNDYSSEGLLALPELQHIDTQRFLIIKGEGGRQTLAATLRARGGHVDELPVYRRLPLDYPAAQLTAAIGSADAAIVTSGEILQRLHALTPASSRTLLCHLQLVVPSERVVQMALSLGFDRVLKVASPLSPPTLVQALQNAHLDRSTTGHNA